jgi:hypothetical protein
MKILLNLKICKFRENNEEMLKGGIKNIKKEYIYIYNDKERVLYIGQFHERLENLWKLLSPPPKKNY